ncbi:hypothetical protein COCNU_05G004450 [Cocos nucifera]|uniref:Late embryogenesis abundant protein LEA-2 subgroup domain-containing protein n=1 Tax=Cocos nucifera TaxID=13894 RepID=A0A8K0I955_COCNU|nr:hypothetical protein COCNU_05G004450 [Cocos nucifera]
MAKLGEQSDPLLHPPPSYPAQPSPYYSDAPAYVLLPAFPGRRLRRPCRCCGSLVSSSTLLTLVFAAALLACGLFFLWPSDPEVRIVRLRLDRVHLSTSPAVSLAISMGLEVRVWNKDFFSLDYDSIVVCIGYRGSRLGSVTSEGGHVRARGVSYVDAELHIDGIQVINDAFYLIEDFVRGSIPFDTITKVEGKLHLFFFDIPIQVNTSLLDSFQSISF